MRKSKANPKVPEAPTGEQIRLRVARNLIEPQTRHALCAQMFIAPSLSGDSERPAIPDYLAHVRNVTELAEAGDMTIASRIPISQALSLDSMFTDMARRAVINFNDYPDAADRFMRLALKSQANSRATLESLAKLHQPREQTVRHVHVNEGGQAVIADQFHNHTGISENANRAKQPHERLASAADECAALPSPEPSGRLVSLSSDQGAGTLSPTWRSQPRTTAR